VRIRVLLQIRPAAKMIDAARESRQVLDFGGIQPQLVRSGEQDGFRLVWISKHRISSRSLNYTASTHIGNRLYRWFPSVSSI